jgi:L-asparaginase
LTLAPGAGNITHDNLPCGGPAYTAYQTALRSILRQASSKLKEPGATALDVATYAVTLLENDALFNSGHGAVYTTAGTHELEASVMVSRGYRKRGAGVMKVTRAKHPILLAKEMLIRGDADDGEGAGQHVQLHGETCDRLAGQWGLEMVRPSYYWTRRRWDEHRRGLGWSYTDGEYEAARKAADEGIAVNTEVQTEVQTEVKLERRKDRTWDGKEYLPQGTVGCVVLDSTGAICAATSTGGLTNKLPGRIGDTPTIGAGFWAEEWSTTRPTSSSPSSPTTPPLSALSACLPGISAYLPIPFTAPPELKTNVRAVGMSGTGNGDSFLKLNAVRTAAAIARFSRNHPATTGMVPLQDAVSAVAGPNGVLQQSAAERWKKTGEGEGGIIGVDYDGDEGTGEVVMDFNSGGMSRAWVDDLGVERVGIFREGVD